MSIQKIISIPLESVSRLEHLMSANGFRHYSIYITVDLKAKIIFQDELEYAIFVLKDFDKIIRIENIMFENTGEFVLKLEKKLKTYKKADSFIIKQMVKGA
jgi:hypothetical protein